MIVAPTDREAKLLDQCLKSINKYVDEICITITGTNDKVAKVAKRYKAKISSYKWDNHFANARNYNFSQATGDWILWLDADDVVLGAEHLEGILEEANRNPHINTIICDYLYEFNEDGDCIVRHRKTRMVKNDKSVEWEGKLHEDFKELRKVHQYYAPDFKIKHCHPDDRRSGARNLEIASEGVAQSPNDPRSYWNYAVSLMPNEKWDEAISAWHMFLKMSNSDMEKVFAYDRLAACYEKLGDIENAIMSELYAIETRPEVPDAWIGLGSLYAQKNDYSKAKFWLLEGLKLKPPTDNMIVYNPRLYDFLPLKMLAKIYYKEGKPEDALICLKELRKMFPHNSEVKKLYTEISKEVKDLKQIEKHLEGIQKLTSREEIKKKLDAVPDEFKHHPKVVHLRNVHFIKTHTTGKEVCIYCPETNQTWTPDSIKTGIGGSEEAIINLSRRWAKAGYDVTVYAQCGHKEFVDKVGGATWKPFYSWNYRDKHDILIFWRHPLFVDFNINAKAILIDMHDCVEEAEFTPKRLKKITKIMVKSKAHRDLYPNVPDNKFVIVPNGLDPEHFKPEVKRQRYKMIMTSSADRGLDCLLDMLPKIREQVPEAELYWYYGWNTFDAAYKNDESQQFWKNELMSKFNRTKGAIEGGRIGHKEIAKEMLSSRLFVYPTEFYEIHCISAAKAQAAGCIPVTTNYAALDTTVKWGKKIKCSDIYTNINKQEEFIKQVVKYLKEDPPASYVEDMMKWSQDTNNWDKIASKWQEVFNKYI